MRMMPTRVFAFANRIVLVYGDAAVEFFVGEAGLKYKDVSLPVTEGGDLPSDWVELTELMTELGVTRRLLRTAGLGRKRWSA